MTETSSFSHPQRLLFIPLITLFLFATSAVNYRPSRAASAEMLQFRSDITGYAQNFVGIKYRYAGTSPNTGFDCSGFTSFALKEFAVKSSSSSYAQSTQGVRVALSDVLPGDLVFFGRSGHIQHVAMVVDRAPDGIIVVHSTCSRGVIVENINTSSYWRPRILFARDVIGRRASE